MLWLESAEASLPVFGLKILMLLYHWATLDVNFHIHSSCSLSPWYVSVVLCSLFLMLLSAGIATVTDVVSPLCLLGWPVATWLSGAWSLTGLQCLSHLAPFDGVSHHKLGNSSLYAAQMFVYTVPATWLCLSVFVVPVCIIYLATVCRTVSGAPLHSLQFGSCWLLVDFCLCGFGV